MINTDKYTFSTPAVLPDGNGGFTPCPELLTEDEAIRYLRLDSVGHKNPSMTLQYYRAKKKLRATQVGRKLFYSKKELDKLIENLTQK